MKAAWYESLDFKVSFKQQKLNSQNNRNNKCSYWNTNCQTYISPQNNGEIILKSAP